MIFEKNGTFLLRTDNWSYLMRVSPYGHLEHLHFGEPVSIEDAEAMALRAGNGWGTVVRYNETDASSCLDYTALEWSGHGRGDFRDAPIDLAKNGMPIATDFRYDSYRILDGGVPMKSTLPQPTGALRTLEITLKMGDLRLLLYWTVYPQVLTRRAVLCNDGADDITVRRLLSTCMDMLGNFEMTTFDGAWLSEMHRHTMPANGAKLVNESATGTSSHHHNPGFLLHEAGASEDHGKVYGFNLIYSGNHYASVQRTNQGLTRVVQGISPDHFVHTLASGDCFETPEAVLCHSSRGFGGVSEAMHEFIRGHILPKAWRKKERPVLFDSWEGCGFDVHAERVVRLAKQAADLGCELFVLDDGWFRKGKRDWADLGDFTADPEKLPEGIEKLADDVRACGIDFGIWLEPENVNPDSDLYRAHPDWVLTEPDMHPVVGRHTLVLDLSLPQVREHIVKTVGEIIDKTGAGCVKWDMNRHSTALGDKAHACVLGLYEVLHRIFAPRPQVLLLSSAAGGSRFDLGMLRYSAQVWSSDDTDPIDRLDIQSAYSMLYPQCVVGANVSHAPQGYTGRLTPLSTRGCVASFAALGYELDLAELGDAEKEEIRRQIAFYKEHRALLQFGTFRRIETPADTESWQVSDGETTILGVFHRLVHAAPEYEVLRVKGLQKDKVYTLTSRAGIQPEWQARATGAAFAAGIAMPPRFHGLGKDETLRFPADFESNLFVIE